MTNQTHNTGEINNGTAEDPTKFLNPLIKCFKEIMKQEGQRLDPSLVEIEGFAVDVLDPYEIGFKGGCSGRLIHARNPHGPWVVDEDIPDGFLKRILGDDERKLNAMKRLIQKPSLYETTVSQTLDILRIEISRIKTIHGIDDRIDFESGDHQ